MKNITTKLLLLKQQWRWCKRQVTETEQPYITCTLSKHCV